ncbi:MAG TPA: DUF3455 domain-containing protein [Pyrinomonadaceae bacterium]|nr:DUF3455 domain-containing protein [Pyrinomonadaceae bacterium]
MKTKEIAATTLLVVLALGHLSVTFGLAVDDSNQTPVLPAGCEQLAPPAGHRLAYHVYAVGVQIYRWNGTTWSFIAPEANLFASANYRGLVGSHYGGPTWETNSGSLVASLATTAIPCTPDPTAIPWLRLTAVSSSGPGVLDGVTYIQRINTIGGIRPAAGTVVGQEARIPYTTEYYFYKEEN